MPSKLRKAKGGVAGKIAKGALSVASNFVPGGGILKAGLSVASKFPGIKPIDGRYPKPRRKSALYYLKRIPIEKAKARLTKIKMSAYKGL